MERKIGWICAVAAGIFVLSTSACEAQLGRQLKPIQNTGRFLGAGYGLGYHRCNPGHDTSYYNPWNAKNSFLISRSPEYLGRFSQQRHLSPMDLLYSQQQGYPGPVNNFGQTHFGTHNQPAISGPQIDADFQPVQNRQEDNAAERDAEKRDSGNDFVPANRDVEDTFESEADALDNDRPLKGGFDDLKESLDNDAKKPATETDGANATSPTSVFLNSSFSGR